MPRFAQVIATAVIASALLATYSGRLSCLSTKTFSSQKVPSNGGKVLSLTEAFVRSAGVRWRFNIEERVILRFGLGRLTILRILSPKLTGASRVDCHGSIYTLISQDIAPKSIQALLRLSLGQVSGDNVR